MRIGHHIIEEYDKTILRMAIIAFSELKKQEGKVLQNLPSATGNWLAARLLHIEHGKAEMEVKIRKEMTNPYGNIHGGMMATIIDETIGWAVISAEFPVHYTSVNLSIDFLYAASLDELIIAKAEIVRAGKKMLHTSVNVYNLSGLLLARASSNLVVTGMAIKMPTN